MAKKAQNFLQNTRKMLKKEVKPNRSALTNTSKDPMCENDFRDVPVASSWIKGAQFQPHNKGQCDVHQKGDFVLIVKKSGKRYVYPNVQRRVYQAFINAPSKGKFYWYGGGGVRPLRSFSTEAGRRLVNRRMRRSGGLGTRRR